MSNLRSASYRPPSPQGTQAWPQVPMPSSSCIYTGSAPQASINRSNPPVYSYSPTSSSAEASPTSDFVPLPRRHVSPESPGDQYTPTGGNVGNQPMRVQRCWSCKTTLSPEWHEGPSGKKELCMWVCFSWNLSGHVLIKDLWSYQLLSSLCSIARQKRRDNDTVPTKR